MTKYIILDTGTLINMTSNGLLDIFRNLEKIFQGNFLVTDSVKYEAIDHPRNIKRFEWGAIRIEQLLDDEVIRMIEDEDLIDLKQLNAKTEEVLRITNSVFKSEGQEIHLIDRGEAECLALSLLLADKKIDCAVALDERTARMLCENPENLHKLMENKLHTTIEANFKQLKPFQNIKIIRSAELMYLAFKHGATGRDRKILESILYALKFGGCSISEKEIEAMKSL